MALNGTRKRCLTCKTQMERRGKTAQGKQRWKCLTCHVSAIKSRNDQRNKKRWSLFIRWLTSKWSLHDFAAQERVTVRTLSRWFEPL
jgi:transposase-like protein